MAEHGRVQDHFRKVAKPSFANVYRDRSGLLGVVEFESREVGARCTQAACGSLSRQQLRYGLCAGP